MERKTARTSSRVTPAVALLALGAMSGCYLSHRPPDPVAGDAGVRPADAAVDAVIPPPPPPRCALTPRLSLLAAADTRVSSMDSPDLVLAGERLALVIFENNSEGHPVVKLTYADLELSEASPLVLVGEESHGWGEGAWTGDALGVCWHGDPGGLGALRFREVTDERLGPRTDFESGSSSCMDLEFAHGLYAMTWRDIDYDASPVIVDTTFALMRRDGTLASEPIVLAAGEYPGPSPALVPTDDGFLATVHTEEGLRIVEVGRDGRMLRDRALSAPEIGYTAIAIRDEHIGLLSFVGPASRRAIVFRVVDRESLEVLVERTIERGTFTSSYPRLEARPEGWALLWSHGSRPSVRAMMLSVDSDGVPIAPRRVVYEGRHSGYGGPSMVSHEGSVYIAISHVSPTERREASYLERWDCEVPSEDICAEEHAEAGECPLHVHGWRWTGEFCEAVVGCGDDCVGEHCGSIALTRFACESDHRECAGRECVAADNTIVGLCVPAETRADVPKTVTLNALVSICPCDPRPRCRVEQSGELELTISVETCDDRGECDCGPAPYVETELTCVIPPLSPDVTWTVRAPEGEPFEITARPPWEEPSGELVCQRWD